MTDRTARFDLPLILPGQAQKEVFHNEALAAIDILLHAAVEGERATPPTDAMLGACWIVAAGAEGVWEGRENMIAAMTAGGWRFVAERPGLVVWDKDLGVSRRWTDSGWSDGTLATTGLTIGGEQVVAERQPEVASPSGGTVIDLEARAAIDALIVTLKSHGLMD